MPVRNGEEARDRREVIGLETYSKLDLVGENERIRKCNKKGEIYSLWYQEARVIIP